jgi:GTP-binding protein EngB required for normal cell division
MTAHLTIPHLSESELRTRYDLLCRACHTESAGRSRQLAGALKQLHTLVHQELPELARQGSPDHFAEILAALGQELERFHEFCEFPDLGQKVVVGFGGAFSAGKSSLINALLGKKHLATEVDPTTSLPTYLLHGATAQITALNLFGCRVDLTAEAFLTLTHDETQRYGTQIGRLLRSAFISLPDFHWPHVALLDTPGYSKPNDAHWSERTDAHLARAQLNSAQYVIWVVSAEAGTIPEDDLRFLATLRHDIPRLVVISRADKRTPDDMAQMVDLVRTTLARRGLAAIDVLPFTRSPRQQSVFPLEPLMQQLTAWNTTPRRLSFAVNFKRQFMAYQRFIEAEQQRARLHLNRLNRILGMTDDADVLREAQDLRDLADAELRQMQQIGERLYGLRQQFFKGLKQIGDAVGIPLPEPEAIELLELNELDVLGMLRKLREQREPHLPDYQRCWQGLMQPLPLTLRQRLLENQDNNLFKTQTYSQIWMQTLPVLHQLQLIRRFKHDSAEPSSQWYRWTQERSLDNHHRLIRRSEHNSASDQQVWPLGMQALPVQHKLQLIRRFKHDLAEPSSQWHGWMQEQSLENYHGLIRRPEHNSASDQQAWPLGMQVLPVEHQLQLIRRFKHDSVEPSSEWHGWTQTAPVKHYQRLIRR